MVFILFFKGRIPIIKIRNTARSRFSWKRILAIQCWNKLQQNNKNRIKEQLLLHHRGNRSYSVNNSSRKGKRETPSTNGIGLPSSRFHANESFLVAYAWNGLKLPKSYRKEPVKDVFSIIPISELCLRFFPLFYRF